MSYQPMPSARPPGPPPGRGPAPSSVTLAVRLMLVNAALGIIGVIVLFATKDALRDEIRDKNLDKSTADIDSLVNTAITIGLIFGIILLALYVLLALQVGKGKNWARITTWVFAGLGVLSALSSLARTAPAASKTFSLIGGVLDVAIIVLLAQRTSNEYFRKPTYYPPTYYPPTQ
jgi:uncharacterized membrane protein